MVLWVLACCYSFSEEVKLTSPNHTTVHDDHYAEVPLQFVFPFYGGEFETSYMFTNGVVGFRNPTDNSVESHWCCNGRDLQTMADNGQNISRYGYAIAPLWTDLIDLGAENSGLFAEGNTSQQTYKWRNLAEYSWPYDATTLNSFELQIKPDGSYTVDYTAVDIQNHAVTIGDAGNLSQGIYEGTQQQYYSTGYVGILTSYGNEQNSINVLNTLCAANALYDPQCSGYSEAYAQQLFEQECMYNPQYDPTCNGYVEPEPEPEVVLIEEVLEQPDLTTDFTSASGYEIEGIPSFTMPTYEEPQVFEPEIIQVEPEPIEAPVEMQQELEREIAVVEPQPSELEQSEVLEPEVGEEPIEEVVEAEEEPEPREEPIEEVVEAEEELEELEIVEEREEPVDEQKDRTKEQPIEATAANKQAPTKKNEKKQALTKNEKLKILVAKKAIALTKRVENATTLEQQVQVQQQLLSLISFVPDFNYAEQEIKDLASFYPPQENVDSSFSRWFRTDPNFEVLEDSQYPQRNTQWQR